MMPPQLPPSRLSCRPASRYTYTTQKEVRAAFWEAHPTASKERIPSFEGHGVRCYVCDTRCAFVDFVDSLARNGNISESLADRVTL